MTFMLKSRPGRYFEKQLISNKTIQEVLHNYLMDERCDVQFKLLIVGDPGTGKTSLLLRYAYNTYSEIYKTCFPDFKCRKVEMDGQVIKLQIWDTAGREKFRPMTVPFYRGTQGIIIVFDLTDPHSFDNISSWLIEIDSFVGGHVAKLLVGNKYDLAVKRSVPYGKALEFADKQEMPYLETSAKTGTNVETAFMTLTAKIKEHFDKGLFTKHCSVANVLDRQKRAEDSCIWVTLVICLIILGLASSL